MSNFNIDDEINKAVDKIADQLKTRLKKMVVRSEKQVLRQYIASQKETARAAKHTKSSGGRVTGSGRKAVTKKATAAPSYRAPKREQDYGSASESEYSDSD
jgi:ribosomal protein L4